MRKIYFLIMMLIALIMSGCMVTPRPLTMQEIEQRTKKDLEAMFAEQEPITGPVTLFEAMARAIRYNLDYRLKLMETALANRQLELSRYEVLPRLVTAAGYSYRSEYSGAYSQSLITGNPSLEASTSQEKDIITTDISMMWNVLDFGVSYVNAHQQADRFLISEERCRKVIQNIIQDVLYAYWRAVVSEPLLKEMKELLTQAGSALERSREIGASRLRSPREALEYQRQLLESIRLLRELIQRLAPAKTELATLMNLPPGTSFQLPESIFEKPEIPLFRLSIDDLEDMALINRPELREEDYRERISAFEVRKAIMKMLPGIELNFGYNTDSNDFLYNKSWWDAGARISLNIFNLFSGPAAYRAAKAVQKTDKVRRMAMGMAVLTQVHLAYQRFNLVKEEYLVARELDDVNTRLNAQTLAEKSVGRADELTVIQNATNALVARMRHHLMYAELRNAAGRIFNSIGTDLFPAQGVKNTDISSLAEALEQAFDEWEREMGSENDSPK